MDGIISALSGAVRKKAHGNNDDPIDRLNWKISGMLMVAFVVTVFTRQYVGDPIECWSPAEFTDNYKDFTESLCWVKNTYYISIDDPIPKSDALKPQLVYYQWVAFILLFQGLLFFIPSVVWASITNHMAISIHDLTEAGQVFCLATKHAERDKTVGYITRQIDYFLKARRRRHQAGIERKLKIFCSKRQGNLLVFTYLLIKVIYIANCIGQYFLLNQLLGKTGYFTTFGFDIIKNMFAGAELIPESKYFPRVTLCDFKVRAMGGIVRPYTVECVLPVNLFSEKIFIFIWFWLCFTGLLTLINLIIWIVRLVVPPLRRSFVKRYLAVNDIRPTGRAERGKLDEFIKKYLRDDGVFILRMLVINSNDLVTAQVVKELWESYRMEDEEEDMGEDDSGMPLKPLSPGNMS